MASKIFVGNLDFKTRREDVEALFAQVGPVRDVFLPTDRETGRPRGFAFVEYEDAEQAAKAIEKFNGHELGGRALRVNAAEDRPRRGPGAPGGGAGRSFGGPGGGPGRGGDFAPRNDFSPDDFGRGGDFGFDGRGGGGAGGKAKGSRRNVRARKRTL